MAPRRDQAEERGGDRAQPRRLLRRRSDHGCFRYPTRGVDDVRAADGPALHHRVRDGRASPVRQRGRAMVLGRDFVRRQLDQAPVSVLVSVL